MLDDQSFSVTVAAGGTAHLDIRTRTRLQTWTVQQISVEMANAPLGATCMVRKNGAIITPLIPTGDAAAGEPFIPLRGTDLITVDFTGCTPGDIGTVYMLYDDGNEPT